MTDPHLDPIALPMSGTDMFWSSTTPDSTPWLGQLVNFTTYTYYEDPYSLPSFSDDVESWHSVRCVRGGTAPTPRYTDNGNGTVRDNRRGLVWEKAPTQGGLVPREAQSYCSHLALAGGGWRVPTIQELVALSDNAAGYPTLDSVFQSVSAYPPAVQWSSTPYSEVDPDYYDAAGWLMASDGSLRPEANVGAFPPGDVRCVR